MTRCTRWFLPLLLLPLPTAPPYFLVLFLFSLTMHARPCFYCIILLTTLFISSCYWQPFPLDTPLSIPWSENISTFADALNATLSPDYSLPQPTVIRAADRCWCDLTSGNFFEPFNVSHWEYVSVQRLKDSLEKKQKALVEHSQDSTESSGKPEKDSNVVASQDTFSTKIWSALKEVVPSIYNSSFRTSDSDAQRSRFPRERHSVANNTTQLPLIRGEYDLRPYGLNMVLDFTWSR